MAIPISSIVNVQISRQTQAVPLAAFGVPLILGTHSYTTSRIEFVEDLAGVVALGFTTSDTIYKIAQDLFGQTPRPNRVAIGRKDANVQRVLTVDFSADFVADNVIDLRINGLAIDSVTFNTDHATTMGLLETAIEAKSDYVASATVSGNDIVVTFKSGVDGSISDVTVTGGASQPTATVVTTEAGKTFASELDLLVLESEDWYQLIIDSAITEDILSAAAWVESHNPKKIFSYRADASGVKDSATTTDIASKLATLAYDRTFGTYHVGADEYADAAIVGRMAPEAPGSATFKFKSLSGISADALTQTEVNTLVSKKMNHYVNVGGISIYKEGVVSSGEYIDVMIGVDWIESEIQSRIYTQLAQSKKIPYTDGGVGVIQNEISRVLNEAIGRGILAESPAPSVTVPLVANVSAANKAGRVLPDVSFTGVLAGAIHKVNITGTVSI